MKLLLDMYRSAPKEQRDKVQLMAAEKKYNSEVITLLHHTSVSSARSCVQKRHNTLVCYHGTDVSPPLGSLVIFTILIPISGRGAAAEAEGTGGKREEGREKNGRRRGSKEDPLCGGADRYIKQEALHS